MREYYFLTGLDESPYQLTLLDALHLGATERLGVYALAEHEITLKNPDTGAEESGKGLYLKLCASTLQQMEKDTSKAERQPPPGYVNGGPRQTQCYGVHEALTDQKRRQNRTNESTTVAGTSRLVLLSYPNGDPFFACLPDLFCWIDDLEQLSREGVIQHRNTDDASVVAPAQPENGSDSAELHRTRRTLAALAIGLAKKHPCYQHGGKPNVKALSEVATDHLRDADGRAPQSFSDETAKKAIAAALKANPELKEFSSKDG